MSFNPKDMIGAKSEPKIIAYLEEIGDHAAIQRRQGASGTGQGLFGFGVDFWDATGVLLGYVAPDGKGDDLDVAEASTIEPDIDLRGKPIRISLERFHVHRYPGSGKHKILCEFLAKHQTKSDREELKYVISTEALDGSDASLMGAPIFLGLCVGKDGIAFEGRCVNVASQYDSAILSLLDSNPLKDGLTLLATAQPAIKPFVGLVTAVLKSVLGRLIFPRKSGRG